MCVCLMQKPAVEQEYEDDEKEEVGESKSWLYETDRQRIFDGSDGYALSVFECFIMLATDSAYSF
jgi:hypothetical protein